MGEYPYYITDNNPFNDVKYLLNRDVLINYTLPAIAGGLKGSEGGHTSFDEYSYTEPQNNYGREYVLYGIEDFAVPSAQMEVPSEDMDMLLGNMEENVVALAKEHPETTFLYFFPPYSMAYWGNLQHQGKLSYMLEGKKAAIEAMLSCENIHIYSFSFYTDITENLDNYRDQAHYKAEINDLVMDRITEAEVSGEAGYDRITKESYLEYLEKEKDLFENYDYDRLLEP
jgi:hypothetical protein